MENIDNKAWIGDFLHDPDTKNFFSKIDYELKDGMHFQRQGEQAHQFNFIDKNLTSLSLFYSEIFKVNLSEGGERPNSYFFLDFNEAYRSNIPYKYRESLKNEYIIIGFIIYKIVFIDKDLELNSIQKLKEKIRIEYDDYKPGIYRLIAKSRNTTPGNLNDNTIDSVVTSTLNEFKRIGWVTLYDDEFNTLPAFERLVSIYEDYILNIDKILDELR